MLGPRDVHWLSSGLLLYELVKGLLVTDFYS